MDPRQVVSLLFFVALVAGLLAAQPDAHADDPPHLVQAKKAMSRARELYNEEKWKGAAELYVRAAQLDPGAKSLDGAPYRNLARCMFWQEKYDEAVFWYDVYRSGWPRADDAEQVFEERRTADTRRGSPGEPVVVDIVYDRSVLELTNTLNERLAAGAPAVTADGGGNLRLYELAIERGYALPDLARWTTALKKQLLQELAARFERAPDGPLPVFSPDAEPLATTQTRLDAVRDLAPTAEEAAMLDPIQRLHDAFVEYLAEDWLKAAASFQDAAETDDRPYLYYAAAVSHLNAGEPKEAAKLLKDKAGAVPADVQPFWSMLLAAALTESGDFNAASRLLVELSGSLAR